ncbi:MAG: aminotransferase class V-fold PLP-dependent enzyme [Leptospira sp.]|nr:aminotransferase class V-fold PLP-dependent enzyme [Leptospira sp.]
MIYLDYNATHPPIPKILNEVNENYLAEFYNPSGATRYSLNNQGKIEESRKYFSSITGIPEKNIIFSSSGTEANYLLIRFLTQNFINLTSVIVSPFEHPSIYSALDDHNLTKYILETNKSGVILLDHLEKLLEKHPRPIICLAVANETGVIQPSEEIAALANRYSVPFYSDLMQAFGKQKVNFDLFSGFTFSGHKIGAGMGASLTAVRHLTDNTHIFAGGNQENNHRAGTENWPAIIAFQKASEYQLEQLESKNSKLKRFQNILEAFLVSQKCEIIGKNANRLPNTSFVLLPIEEIDFFLLGLEEAGVIVSTGSSCKSRAREASSSLLSMGYTKEEALRCIRISTGIFTTEDEIHIFCEKARELLITFGVNH